MTLLVDVNRPGSQEDLVSNEACLQFGDASLGLRLPPPALAVLTCLSLAGDGPVHSQLALLSPLFCERAQPSLKLGLFMG